MIKKNTLRVSLKFTVLFFGLLLLLWNCQTDDQKVQNESKTAIRTVEKEEALNILRASFQRAASKGQSSKANAKALKLEDITYEEIANTSESILVMETKDRLNTHLYSRILMLEVNDSVQSVILHMSVNKEDSNDTYTGKMYLSDLEGELLYGYRIEKGQAVAKLVKTIKESGKAAKSSIQSKNGYCAYYFDWDCVGPSIIAAPGTSPPGGVLFKSFKDSNGNCHNLVDNWVFPCEQNSFELEEVVVTANTSSSSTTYTVNYLDLSYLFYPGGPSYSNYTYQDISNYYWNYGGGSGPPVALQIINSLTGKANCIYDKLNETSTGFKNMIKMFDGEFPVNHLKLESSTSLASNINAKTLPPNDFVITIQINMNNLSRPNLSIARTIIHEVIHAEMYRKISSILDNGGNLDGLTKQEWNQKLSNGDYPGIYDYYSRFGVNNMQHEQIAAHYRSTISDFLKEFQSGLPQSTYDALAWVGLKDTETWNSLSSSEKNNINNTINSFNSIGSENCN